MLDPSRALLYHVRCYAPFFCDAAVPGLDERNCTSTNGCIYLQCPFDKLVHIFAVPTHSTYIATAHRYLSMIRFASASASLPPSSPLSSLPDSLSQR